MFLVNHPVLHSETLTGTYTAWKLLLTMPASFNELKSFIINHPNWPRQNDLRKKAEQVMDESMPDQVIMQWFEKYPPLTGKGNFLFAQVLIRADKLTKATEIIKNTWHFVFMDPKLEQKFYTTFARHITHYDTYKRADKMLCNEEISAAKSTKKYTSQIYKEVIDARLALIKEEKQAQQKAKILQRIAEKNDTLVFELIRYHRRQHQDFEAINLIKSGSTSHEQNFPQHWWTERHILARRMMEKNKFSEAFKLISGHKLKEGEDFFNAEWLIGWFDLRRNKQATKALERFKKLYHNAKSPISKARMAFWAAESYKFLGRIDDAEVWFQRAANFSGTFYGQLAQAKLNVNSANKINSIKLLQTRTDAEDERKFANFEMVKMLKIIARHEDKQFLMPIIKKCINDLSKSEHHLLLLKLVKKNFGEAIVAKTAREMGKKYSNLFNESFPILSPVMVQKIHKIALNKAHLVYLVHAIIWCESGFQEDAKSLAGALGLMQIMPAVAAKEAKRFPKNIGVKLPNKKSNYNSERNVLLGTSHINYLLDNFLGNLVLTIAAYNAGSSAVSEWIECFGDPRTSKIDIVDWIELISYGETRNYVQRVLEKFMIYLSRLKHLEPKTRDLLQFMNMRFE